MTTYPQVNKDFGHGFDWRGTKLEIGQTVICTAKTRGTLLEGTIKGFTPHNVKVEVKYQATHWGAVNRSFGYDQVTVVEQLPPCAIAMTEAEHHDEMTRIRKVRQDNYESHSLSKAPDRPRWGGSYPYGSTTYSLTRDNYERANRKYLDDYEFWKARPCTTCGATMNQLEEEPCGTF